MGLEEFLGIRPEWNHALASACQVLAGDTLDPDPERFRTAIRRFSGAVPEPCSPIEAAYLHDSIVANVTRAGVQFHQRFHRRISTGPCTGSPVEAAASVLTGTYPGPRARLLHWCNAYLGSFNQGHRWPLAIRAASLIERRFREHLSIAGIARDLGGGESTVVRSFARAFGMSMHTYQMRVRLLHVVPELREPGSNVDAVARSNGYDSTKNMYRGLRAATGLRPAELRNLSEASAQHLLQQLALPAPLMQRRDD